jgi:hypothetical protein
MKPMPKKPRIIIAHVEGSGTAATSAMVPCPRISTFVSQKPRPHSAPAYPVVLLSGTRLSPRYVELVFMGSTTRATKLGKQPPKSTTPPQRDMIARRRWFSPEASLKSPRRWVCMQWGCRGSTGALPILRSGRDRVAITGIINPYCDAHGTPKPQDGPSSCSLRWGRFFYVILNGNKWQSPAFK